MGNSELVEVGISGSVGKQVFASTRPVVLKSVIVNTTVSAGVVVIRDGNASGDVNSSTEVSIYLYHVE